MLVSSNALASIVGFMFHDQSLAILSLPYFEYQFDRRSKNLGFSWSVCIYQENLFLHHGRSTCSCDDLFAF
jgi:hypothetical protein